MITTQQKMNDVLRFRAWHKPTKRMFDVYCLLINTSLKTH